MIFASDIHRKILKELEIPLCVIDSEGKVIFTNNSIVKVFLYPNIIGKNIYALIGLKVEELISSMGKEEAICIKRNEKSFKINVGRMPDNEYLLSFEDYTDLGKLTDDYKMSRTCIAIINVDNFDELALSKGEDKILLIRKDIDNTIRKWAATQNSSITRYSSYQYLMISSYGNMQNHISNKFTILDEIRKIGDNYDFPITLSIGVGIGQGDLSKRDGYARDALNMALGRGGDQVVVIDDGNINYYGGKSQFMDHNNKGKSKVIAHALMVLIEKAPKIVIMQHRDADMDSFGAAIGIYRFAKNIKNDVSIIMGSHNETLSDLYKYIKKKGNVDFISPKKALEVVEKDTLVIVVDTHQSNLVEEPKLLDISEKKVVIDHHRKGADVIKDLTLEYMAPHASSASELVSEILQYSESKQSIDRSEAEAILAGITMDTNRFAVKTGVRTFEAAAWLKRAGADTTSVKRFFQMDLDVFKTIAKGIIGAEIINDSIAFSTCEGVNKDAQVLCAQIADELLMIKGIKASFVIGQTSNETTVVSARSLGDFNVQVIMEKLGGGGHLTTAACQSRLSVDEVREKIEEVLEVI